MHVMFCLLRHAGVTLFKLGVSASNCGSFLLNLGVSGDWWQRGNERAPPALNLPHAHDKSVCWSLFLLTDTQQFHCFCCRTVFPCSCSCAHKDGKSSPLKRCRPRVLLLGWRPTITFLGSVAAARLLASFSPSWCCGDRLLPGVFGYWHCFRSALHRTGRLH